MMRCLTTTLVALLVGNAVGAVGPWQQCGGQNYVGETVCTSDSGCVKINDYYSQCQPGAAPAPVPTTTARPPTTTTTLQTQTQTQRPSPTTTAGSTPSTPSNTGPGTTLQTGWLWIRAVAAPNFHKYIQTNPLYTSGPAILGSYTTAGQLRIADGQLEYLISSPSSPVTVLYANVSPTPSINGLSLAVTFETTKNSYGSFAFGGDDLQWSAPGVSRPNKSAWYVCGGQQLYVNLGNYLYNTPAGCADQTVHYYNDKTANN